MTIPTTPETWAEKKARLAKRGRRERTFTLIDHETAEAVEAARAAVGEVELQVRSDAQRKYRNADLSAAEREKAIRADVAKSRKVATARKALATAEQNHEAQNVTIVLRALGSDVYEELHAAHPPRAVDEKKGRDYNLETFAPALIAACSTDDMEPEDAAELIRDLSQGEAGMLFTQAVEVNQTGRVALGKG